MFQHNYDFYWPPSRDDHLFRSYIESQFLVMFGILFIVIAYLTRLLADPLLWITASLLFSFFIQFPLYYIASTRRKNLITRSEYLQILANAQRRLGVTRTVIPLLSDDKGHLLTSANTPFKTGILVSKRAAELIEEHPVEGEIVLAHELAKLKRDRIVFNMLRNIGAFYYGIVFEGMFFAEFILSILPLLETIPLWIPALIMIYPWGFGIAFWYNQKAAAELEVESAYGMNPELATFIVFSKKKMSSEGRRHYIHEIESNIEMRRSRTWLSMIGKPLFYSLIIIVITYIAAMNIPSPFTDLFVVIIGGIVFVFLVYGTSKIGTQKPGRPEFYEPQRSQKVEDETSTQVAKLLSMKNGNAECEIRSSLDVFEEEFDLEFYEVHICGETLWMWTGEWDLLESPELISSYLEGELVRQRAGLSNKAYVISFVVFLALMIGGFALLIPTAISSIMLFLAWIVFSFVILAIMIFIINLISNSRQNNSEFVLAEQNPYYVQALQILARRPDSDRYRQGAIRRRLERIERHQR